MNTLNRVLKRVEEASYRARSITLKPGRQVLLDDTVGSSEEGENMLDKMLLVLSQLLKDVLFLRNVLFLRDKLLLRDACLLFN